MKTAITPNEMLKLLETAKAKSTRDWAMILIAFRHGLRASEVINLTLDDLKSNVLTVHRLKGSKTTSQPLMPHRGKPLLDEVKAMKTWLAERPTHSGSVLFPSNLGGAMDRSTFYRLFRTYATEAGLPPEKAHPHCLKHSCATNLIRSGVDLAFVKQHLGHSAIASTMQYLDLNDTEAAEKAQDAFMKAFD